VHPCASFESSVKRNENVLNWTGYESSRRQKVGPTCSASVGPLPDFGASGSKGDGAQSDGSVLLPHACHEVSHSSI
jgi:hypothetical protein